MSVPDVVVKEEVSCMPDLVDTPQDSSESAALRLEGRGGLLPPPPSPLSRSLLLALLYPNLDLEDLNSVRLRIIGILLCLLFVVSFPLEE
jgi:hypothetical protein